MRSDQSAQGAIRPLLERNSNSTGSIWKTYSEIYPFCFILLPQTFLPAHSKHLKQKFFSSPHPEKKIF